ncbi:hypothetical protein SBV1_810030 [Verrucomicrobia bacterium]|nr:hypothetical protein SBV1_810030 [Verrucomicrobiota bacterium]
MIILHANPYASARRLGFEFNLNPLDLLQPIVLFGYHNSLSHFGLQRGANNTQP